MSGEHMCARVCLITHTVVPIFDTVNANHVLVIGADFLLLEGLVALLMLSTHTKMHMDLNIPGGAFFHRVVEVVS